MELESEEETRLFSLVKEETQMRQKHLSWSFIYHFDSVEERGLGPRGNGRSCRTENGRTVRRPLRSSR